MKLIKYVFVEPFMIRKALGARSPPSPRFQYFSSQTEGTGFVSKADLTFPVPLIIFHFLMWSGGWVGQGSK